MPNSRRLSHRFMLTQPLRVVGIACLLGWAVPPCFGQSLGDLARQERARRQSQPAVPQHIYTNEDLVRPRILLPEDRARVEAPRTVPAAAPVATQVSPAPPNDPETPLGDVARYYRQVKQIRERQAEGALPGLRAGPLLASPVGPLLAPKIEPASGQARVAPDVVPPVGLPLAPPPNDAPLGDVARYYRWLKAVREARSQAAAAARGPAPLVTSTLPGAGPAPLASPGDHPPSLEVSRSPRSPEPELPRRVRVVGGDSLWKLAQHYLGSGGKWRELAALNPQIVDPCRLQIGDWIRLPALASPPSPPGVARTIRVRKGDTLWKIAATDLGSGYAWTCIARANPDLADANLIFPEQVLNLPLGCGASSYGSLVPSPHAALSNRQ